MILTNKDLLTLCNTAILAAKQAGKFIAENANKNIAIQNKTGADSLASQVVTEVDFKAQEIILKTLAKSILDYDLALLTEESAFVSDINGDLIQLNRPETSFMNKNGVLFASNKEISDQLISFYKTLS